MITPSIISAPHAAGSIKRSLQMAEFDPLDSASIDHELDPLLLDRPPSRRSKVYADRLLSILDELERRNE